MLAVTQGDPAGIGPELSLRLMAQNPEVKIFGSKELLFRVAQKLALPFHAEMIIEIPLPDRCHIEPGHISAEAGAHSFRCLELATEATLRQEFSALVTNPIHKEAWHEAGINYPGHTEYLVAKTDSPAHAMMLSAEELTCSLVTTHIALADVPGALTEARMLEVIHLTAQTMERLHHRPARLAMPGLNPHAGEGGLFGKEEIELIIPALEKARAQGVDIIGPLSPDTAFLPGFRKNIDAYVCLYHDQGLIPLKTLSFDTGVNITLGLPIIRTSVDHGTAFDIAWTGKAELTSLLEAVKVAQRIAS